MSKNIIITFIVLFFTNSAFAIEMKEEPIQQILLSEVRYAAGDEFEKANQTEYNDTNDGMKNSGAYKKYSMPKAVLLSALLPGLGENYIGQKGKARYFFAVEAASWISVLAFRKYGLMREDDMIRHASVYANAQLEGKDEEFINWVRFYDDIDQFNSLGRVSDPDRAYLEDTPENHWRWESHAAKEEFAAINNSSSESFRRARFAVGVAVVNRLVSVIDVILSTKKANDRLETEFAQNNKFNYKLKINPFSQSKIVSLTIYTPF